LHQLTFWPPLPKQRGSKKSKHIVIGRRAMEILLGLLCFLFGLALVLAVIAVVGHGIWLMMAAMFGGGARPHLDDQERRSRRRGDHACIGCGEIVSLEDAYCLACGLNPIGKPADELRDLEAAERMIDGLFEAGSLSAAARQETIRSIEARREDLLPRRRRPVAVEAKPIEQLEGWFGADQGQGSRSLTKQQALALLRSVPSGDLGDLSPRARCWDRPVAGVGRHAEPACQAYRVLCHFYPKDRISAIAAPEAIQAAIKIEDWTSADEFVRIVTAIPGLVAKEPELAMLIGQVRSRDAGPTPAPVVTPIMAEAQPIEDGPILLQYAEPTLTPSAEAPSVTMVAAAAPAEEPTIVAMIEDRLYRGGGLPSGSPSSWRNATSSGAS